MTDQRTHVPAHYCSTALMLHDCFLSCVLLLSCQCLANVLPMSCELVSSLLHLSVCKVSADYVVMGSAHEAISQNWHFSLYRNVAFLCLS